MMQPVTQPETSLTKSLCGRKYNGTKGKFAPSDAGLMLDSVLISPRQVLKTILQALQNSARILKDISSQTDAKSVWQEFRNKLEAFSCFEYVDSYLQLSGISDKSFPRIASQAGGFGPYLSVWVMEGLGHYFTGWWTHNKGLPLHLLSGLEGTQLPEASLAPLHTGMGLSLSQSLLSGIDSYAGSLQGKLIAFRELCRSNSQRGYGGAAFEALGLVARNLYPHLICGIDAALPSDVLRAYFWHGIGRGIYFAPLNFFPFRSAPWRGLEECLRQAPHETGRRNAVAGFAWALTLVNIRHPEIIAEFLGHHAAQMNDPEAVFNGICSALTIWRDAAPSDIYSTLLERYIPERPAPQVWDWYVKRACDYARRSYRAFSRERRLEELFRYQDDWRYFDE